jgi:hypothetical protein
MPPLRGCSSVSGNDEEHQNVTYIVTQNCVDLPDKTCSKVVPFNCLGSPGGAASVGKIHSDIR